jgi:tetratricopeptide (TPR) repeat protein
VLTTKCAECEETFPVRDTCKAGDRVLCIACCEKLISTPDPSAPEIKHQVDPTVCNRCGFDNGRNPLPALAEQPMCDNCIAYLRNRPFPRWIKIGFAGLIVFVLLSAAWNMRFVLAWMETREAFNVMAAGRNVETAAERMKSASRRVPESTDIQSLSAYLDGLAFLKQDKPAEALESFEKCRGRLPSAYGIDNLILQAKAGAAFDSKDYDGFLDAAKEFVARLPEIYYGHAMLASAYACKYALTGDKAFHKQAMACLDRARAVTSPDAKQYEEDYEQRILYRLHTRQIINREEYNRHFPNGWRQGKED